MNDSFTALNSQAGGGLYNRSVGFQVINCRCAESPVMIQLEETIGVDLCLLCLSKSYESKGKNTKMNRLR